MRFWHSLLPAVILVTFLGSPVALGQDPPTAEANLKATLAGYLSAFNQRETDAISGYWAEDAVWQSSATGEQATGRAAIMQGFAEFFAAQPDAKLAGEVATVQTVAPGVVNFTGSTTLMLPDSPPVVTPFVATAVERDGKWQLASVTESSPPAGLSARERLEELAFLVGSWRDEPGDEATVSVDTTVRWGAGETFLVRSYVIDRGEGEPTQGTQILGWDPAASQYRSWTFESDGSFGTGTWTRDGSQWIGRLAQTLADGGSASATQIMTVVDENMLSVETVGREVNGEPLPATPPVRVARVTDEPAAASHE